STKSGNASKCRIISCLLGAVIIASLSAPTAAASSAISSIPGVSTTGNSSFGTVFVAGKNLVPIPAAGTTTVPTRRASLNCLLVINSTYSSWNFSAVRAGDGMPRLNLGKKGQQGLDAQNLIYPPISLAMRAGALVLLKSSMETTE